MWKQRAVWGFGCRLLSPGYAGLRPACGSGAPSGASAAACCHRGTRASGPHVEAARRLELRLPPAATGVRGPPARMRKRHAVWSFGYRPLPPGYAGLRPACGSSTPSGASDAARCPWGTRASGPHVEAARRLGLRLPPVVTGVRGPPARMLKRHAVWVFGWYLGTWASGPHVRCTEGTSSTL